VAGGWCRKILGLMDIGNFMLGALKVFIPDHLKTTMPN
jgi:hypothetical protein